MLKPQLTEHEAKQRADWVARTISHVPPDHPWARCMVQIIEGLADETVPMLVAPPSACSAEDRAYNAGRVAFAEDLLRRLQTWHRAASKVPPSDVPDPE